MLIRPFQQCLSGFSFVASTQISKWPPNFGYSAAEFLKMQEVLLHGAATAASQVYIPFSFPPLILSPYKLTNVFL
jgi:hypothetical protein